MQGSASCLQHVGGASCWRRIATCSVLPSELRLISQLNHNALFLQAHALHSQFSIASTAHLHQRRHSFAIAASRGISQEVMLAQADGTIVPIDKDLYTVGSAADADIRIDRPAVSEQHAQLERRSGRIFCTALVGEEDDLFSDSYTWLDGSQLQQGVAYMVAPGSVLTFGDQDASYTLQFEEAGSVSPAMEMLMKGMAGQASEDVKKKMEES